MSSSRAPRLVRRTPAGGPAMSGWDASQRRVLDHRTGPLIVAGAAGTGKTTTLVEWVRSRIAAGAGPDSVLVLTADRAAARRLRDGLTARLGVTIRGPLVRSFHSYALDLLRRDAAGRGELPPGLLPARDSDLVVRDLLRGDLGGVGVSWPRRLWEAVPLQGFAQELRDLVMRCRERGIEPDVVEALGRRHGREEWVAAAAFARQYERVVGLRSATGGILYDQAELVTAAADLLDADRRRLASERSRLRAVLVDDAQDVDHAQLRLLRALAGDGRTLVAFADPDQAVSRFRGSVERAVDVLAGSFRTVTGDRAPVAVLAHGHRQAAGPAAVAVDLRGRVPRTAWTDALRSTTTATTRAGSVGVFVAATDSEHASLVAGHLRRCHVADGIPWSQMVVLVRGSASAQVAMRRRLISHGVPTAHLDDDTPLGRRPAVAALLLAAAVGSGVTALDEPTAVALLTGPIGGADALWLRAVSRTAVPASWGHDEVDATAPTVRLLRDPGAERALPHRLRGPAQRVRAAIAAGHAAAPRSAPDLLWSVWEASGLGRSWEREALRPRSGRGADEQADLHEKWLSDVAACLDRVSRFTGDRPGVSLERVREHLDEAWSWPLRPDHGLDDGVRITTVHAARGQEWDVVALAGVQEGVWPDLRPRGGLLGTEQLLALAGGGPPGPSPTSERLADERRLLLSAVGRARRHLLVFAVEDEERGEVPSRFLDEIASAAAPNARSPIAPAGPSTEPAAVPGAQPEIPSAAGLVADLRRTVCDPDSPPQRRATAARHLATLAAAGVAGAHPDRWHGLAPVTDCSPLVRGDDPVTVSPSRLAAFLDCQLRWLLETAGGGGTNGHAQLVGTVMHAVAEVAAAGAADVTAEVLQKLVLAELDARWGDARPSPGWPGRRERAYADAMARRLAAWLSDRDAAVVGTEVPFEVDVGRARIRGTADRVELDDDGRAYVIDFKTGSSVVPSAGVREHPQLRAYQLAAEAGAFEALGAAGAGGAELVHLRTAGRSATVRRQAALADDGPAREEAMDVVREAVTGMAGSVFVAMAGDSCRSCRVRTACPLQGPREAAS